jgi:hypothetical protein
MHPLDPRSRLIVAEIVAVSGLARRDSSSFETPAGSSGAAFQGGALSL